MNEVDDNPPLTTQNDDKTLALSPAPLPFSPTPTPPQSHEGASQFSVLLPASCGQPSWIKTRFMKKIKKSLESVNSFINKKMGLKYRKLKYGNKILGSAYFWQAKIELDERL